MYERRVDGQAAATLRPRPHSGSRISRRGLDPLLVRSAHYVALRVRGRNLRPRIAGVMRPSQRAWQARHSLVRPL